MCFLIASLVLHDPVENIAAKPSLQSLNRPFTTCLLHPVLQLGTATELNGKIEYIRAYLTTNPPNGAPVTRYGIICNGNLLTSLTCVNQSAKQSTYFMPRVYAILEVRTAKKTKLFN
jgi:hypothetical protein